MVEVLLCMCDSGLASFVYTAEPVAGEWLIVKDCRVFYLFFYLFLLF